MASLFTTLSALQVGEAVSIPFSLSGTGTTAPYQITLGAGSLPDGMSLNGTSLAGTPTAHGTSQFTLNAVDATAAAQGGPFTGSRQYSLTTLAAVASVPASESIAVGIDGQRSLGLTVANSGNAALSLALNTSDAGCGLANAGWLNTTLPSAPIAAGSQGQILLAIDAAGMAAGSYSTQLCLDTNDPYQARHTIQLTLEVREVVFEPDTLADLEVGEEVSVPFSLSGTGTAAPYQITLGAGSLPDGMSLNGTSLTGTPTAHGTSQFTLNAVDATAAAQGGPFTGSREYTLTTRAAVASVPAAESTVVGLDGQRSLGLTVTNSGNATLTLALNTSDAGCELADAGWLATTLPSAPIAADSQDQILLAIDATGVTAGTHTAQLCLDTNDPYQARHTVQLTLEVRALEITPATLPPALTNAPYAFTLEVDDTTDLVAPLNFSVSGTLPEGLDLDAAGELSGTAGSPGQSQFSVHVSDSTPTAQGGPFTGERAYSFQILGFDMFSDGFEQPLFGKLQLDHYGKASLSLPLVELMAKVGDAGTAHLFDLVIGERRMGVVEGRCEADHCSIRISQRDGLGKLQTGDWLTVESEPMQVQLRVGESSSY